MSAQNDCTMYIYDVDGEGLCVMHFATLKGEIGAVAVSVSAMQKGFFAMQQAMHARMGHTMTLEVDNDEGTVWTVRIGRGDFTTLLAMVNDVLKMTVYRMEGANNGRPNLN